MIIDILLYLLGGLIGGLASILKLLPSNIPVEYIDGLEYFIAKLAYISGFINVPDLLSAIGWLLTFTSWWYFGKLLMWILNLMPFYHGKKIRLPFNDN